MSRGHHRESLGTKHPSSGCLYVGPAITVWRRPLKEPTGLAGQAQGIEVRFIVREEVLDAHQGRDTPAGPRRSRQPTGATTGVG